MTAPQTPSEIVRGMTEAMRKAWIWTVLAVVATDAQRRAFIAGYNGDPCPKHASETGRTYYERALAVRTYLESLEEGER